MMIKDLQRQSLEKGHFSTVKIISLIHSFLTLFYVFYKMPWQLVEHFAQVIIYLQNVLKKSQHQQHD
uniref:Uncharacterized protein n=1 Tax=Vespula pensylvanica TaxID=30213 RepID=A0A834KSI4_VESPE|nr:hypothetical protein H0235_014203 [Vespula pensylvanica]